MRLHGEHVGAIDPDLVRVGIVGLYPFNKFELADHEGGALFSQ